MRPQLCEINHSSAIWLHSFVFLRVFSIRRQGLSLLDEVDRATSVDNQRGRGAAIAGFRTELFGSRIKLCRDSTKSRVIRTFQKIGNPSSHQPLLSLLSSTIFLSPGNLFFPSGNIFSIDLNLFFSGHQRLHNVLAAYSFTGM
jgi:hypothetical protein